MTDTVQSTSAADTWALVEGFLTDIYGDAARDVWVAGFRDIDSGASWYGMQGLERLKRRIADPREADLYFCTGVIRSGASNRTLGEVVAQPVLYADDIGTKVDRAAWDSMFALGFPRPTARIETSPGNESWVWKLEGDATTPERWTELALIRAYMIEKNLTDALHDPTRYLRLPAGWNSKSKYRVPGGLAPSVTVVEWTPGRGLASLDQIGSVLLGRADWRDAPVPAIAMTGAQLASIGAGALERKADMADPLIRMAEVVGLGPVPSTRAGVVDAFCPNMAAHGDRPETGFAFLGGGLCHCNHASCDGLRSPDFASLIRGQYEDHTSALEAMGSRPEDLPLSAAVFEARAAFEQHGAVFAGGGDGDGGESADGTTAVAEADGLAERIAVRALQSAEDEATALGRLVKRFVWVGPVNAFFDTEGRRFLSRDQFDMHEDVVPHFPVGKSGEKRASNRMRNHPERRGAEGVTYKPGMSRAVVMAKDENGMVSEHVNLWTPSGIVAAAGEDCGLPTAWLEMVEHVIPNKTFRDDFLNRCAFWVQFPGVRTPVVPLISGAQGIGKDLMLAPMVTILGAHNVEFVSNTRLESNFNDWQRAALVVLPELRFSADGRMYNQLKDWTGQNAGRVQINGKYKQTYTMEPCANFVAFSNADDAMKGMDPDDRRIAVYLSPAKPKPPLWYKKIAPVLASVAEAERVLAFLLARDLTSFNAFQTPGDDSGSKGAMFAANLSDRARWVRDLLADGGKLAGRKYLTMTEVEDLAAVEGPVAIRRGGLTSHAVRDAFRIAGCESIGQIRSGGGSRLSLWFGPGMSPSERDAARASGAKAMALDAAAEVEAIQKALREGTQTPPK